MSTEAFSVIPAPAAAGRRRPARLLRGYLSCLRLDEILVLQGSPLLGAAFALGRMTAGRAATLAVFAAASCCLVAHIFVLNDWSGRSADLRDPHRAAGALAASGLDRRGGAAFCMALLALSLLLFCAIGPRTAAIALAIAALSALYSFPAFHLKGVPLLGSAAHLLGGELHFLLGYSLFSAVDRRGLAIGSFFALVFVAGHLTQEVRDHEGDLLNGIGTNAVIFGKRRTFAAAVVAFTLADVLLLVLAARGVVPRTLLLAAGLYPLHLYWSLQAKAAGLTHDGIRRLQARYRVLYAVLGMVMAAALLFGRPATAQGAGGRPAGGGAARGNEMRKLHVDHVLVGIADLEAGMRLLAAATGVAPARGGQHPGRGTQNALLSLGPRTYLELIAPVGGGAPPGRELLAQLQQLTPVGWAIGTDDLEATRRRLQAAGWKVSTPRAGSRVLPDGRELHWRTAEVQDMPDDLTPFLIQWDAGTPHPATTSPPGCTFESLAIRHPRAERLAALVKELGVAGDIRSGATPRLSLTLRCPAGRIVLPAR
jgi:4-hydroxybenzoate polyprenyltransferase